MSHQHNLSASSLADSKGTAAPYGSGYKGIPGGYSIAGSIRRPDWSILRRAWIALTYGDQSLHKSFSSGQL